MSDLYNQPSAYPSKYLRDVSVNYGVVFGVTEENKIILYISTSFLFMLIFVGLCLCANSHKSEDRPHLRPRLY